MENLLKLYRERKTFTDEDSDQISEAICKGNITTNDAFMDWVDYMHKQGQYDVMCFGEHYQNLLTHKENEAIFNDN